MPAVAPRKKGTDKTVFIDLLVFNKMCFFTVENGFNELVSQRWVGHKRRVPLFFGGKWLVKFRCGAEVHSLKRERIMKPCTCEKAHPSFDVMSP